MTPLRLRLWVLSNISLVFVAMNLEKSLKRIGELIATFVTQVQADIAMGMLDKNRIAEDVLVPLFSEVYDYPQLVNLNPPGANYPAIDLGDKTARVAIQVSSNVDSPKVKETLESFVRRQHYKEYDQLIIYSITTRQDSYRAAGWDEIIGGKFRFSKESDIRDYRDLLATIRNLPFEKIKRIEEILEQHFGSGKEIAPGVPWNVPYARNPFFTGRISELEQLRRTLTTQGAAAVGQTQAICGLGGIGKTQLAVEYAYEYRDQYEAVFWVRADQEITLTASFGEIATLLELPERPASDTREIVGAVKRWLESHDRWLLVFDNADVPTVVKPYRPPSARGHILVTSRAQSFGVLGITKPLELEELTPDEAVEFLFRRTGREPDETNVAERAAATELAKELGWLPLALEQAGAFIAAHKARLHDYVASYRNRSLRLLNETGPETGDYPHSVATTWLMNFEEVERLAASAKESRASPDLLRASAFLHPDNIPFELIVEAGDALGPEISASMVEAHPDPLALNRTLEPLIRYSLVRCDVEARSYSVHRLVQAVVRDRIADKEKRQWAERVVRALSAVFPDGRYENWAVAERLMPHAKAASGLIDEWSLEIEEAAGLLNNAGWYLRERVEYLEAEPLSKRALSIREKALGPDHPDVAETLNNLASLYQDQGKYEEAAPLYTRALSIREKVLGPDHPYLATTLNNLALLYQDQGKYEEAAPLLTRALSIFEKALGPDHPDLATTLNNLAMLYEAQGKYEEAALLYTRALSIREKVLGPDHPDLATTLNNLAELYRAQGKYDEAAPLYTRALSIFEKALGPDHPNLATTLNNLAALYKAQGKYDEAEPLYKRALTICENALGPDHPYVAAILNNLALLYRDQGKYEEAEPLYTRALSIREKALGPDHPDVAATLNNLALLYNAQGKYEEAELLYKQAVTICENALGPDHPNLARTLNNLALLYQDQGKYEEAEPLYTRALSIVEKALGPDHPYVATALENYSALLVALNRNEEARRMQDRARSIRDRRASRGVEE